MKSLKVIWKIGKYIVMAVLAIYSVLATIKLNKILNELDKCEKKCFKAARLLEVGEGRILTIWNEYDAVLTNDQKGYWYAYLKYECEEFADRCKEWLSL